MFDETPFWFDQKDDPWKSKYWQDWSKSRPAPMQAVPSLHQESNQYPLKRNPMKKITVLSKSVSAFLVLCTLLIVTSVPSFAAMKRSGNAGLFNGSRLVYERNLNPRIGITPDKQAKGSRYTVVNENGRTVMSGTILSPETFYLSTGKLGPGLFSFYIDGFLVQEFAIS